MVDPLSLTALSAAALTQGIGFLYGQISELLKRRRERRAKAADTPIEIPVDAEGLDGRLDPGPVDDAALDRHADQLASLRGLLLPYAEGDRDVDRDNRPLLDQVNAARALLEQVYRQHITFPGEQRPATGTTLTESSDVLQDHVARVIAGGERAVAIGGNLTNSSVTTGDQTRIRRPG